MTCIVGIEHEGGALLAADSMSSDYYSADISTVPKLLRVGDYVFGFTSSWRMGDLLRYHVAFRPAPQRNLHRHVVTHVIPGIRECFKQGGFATQKEGAEVGGEFLIAVRDTVFRVSPDYMVGRSAHGYDSVGSGAKTALGALSATDGMEPKARAKAALAAAEKHTCHVRRPWRLMETVGR